MVGATVNKSPISHGHGFILGNILGLHLNYIRDNYVHP